MAALRSLAPPSVGAAVGAVPGAVAGAVAAVAARVRRTKPLHPRGRVGRGVLTVTEPRPRLGVPLLERSGEHPCVVRWSRAAGLPQPLPDVEGLAVRVEEEQTDLLFASTGTGPLTRFLLAPRLPGRHGPQGTLLPMAGAEGPLLFLATPERPAAEDGEPPHRFVLAVSSARGPWTRVGTVTVPVWGPDEPIRFDPVVHPLDGTRQYPVVRALREPAYLMARRGARPRT